MEAPAIPNRFSKIAGTTFNVLLCIFNLWAYAYMATETFHHRTLHGSFTFVLSVVGTWITFIVIANNNDKWRPTVWFLFPGAIISLLAGCIFFSSPFSGPSENDGRGDGTRWILNGKPLAEGHFAFAVPGTRLQSAQQDQSLISRTFTAETRDGIMVNGIITARYRLTSDPDRLAALADRSNDINSNIEGELTMLIAKRFGAAVAKRTAAELKPSLALDLEVGDIPRDELLKTIGVRPYGMVAVKEIHPYFR